MITAVTDLKEYQRFEQRPFVRKKTCSEHVSFSDEELLLETLIFFEISYGSYQPFNFLPYLSLSTQYSILISQNDRQTDNRLTDRQMNWQTDRRLTEDGKTERQTDKRRIGGEEGRQTDRQADRDGGIVSGILKLKICY